MVWWRGLERAAVALGVCLVASACGVPDVTFVTDASMGDALPDALADAGVAADAAADTGRHEDSGAGESDASPGIDGGVCPDAAPLGFAVCCGAVACGEMCKASDCAKCSICTAPDVCCIHGNGATCHDAGACP